ncbi:sugar transferase [Viridibacillus arvi]|uniref:sugar transferase n=1 Tax=Viridibacillus arvi TaxID=263475 RepID=UPI003CFEC697
MQVNVMERTTFYLKYGKRLLDLIVASILLPIISILILVISFLLLVFSGRPIFFKQYRTGVHFEEFKIWKFRTMKSHQLEKEEKDWQEGVPDDFIFKGVLDSRITTIGKLLRKWSLDELPQIINVLKGEMSLVGPRPEVPDITSFYNADQSRRLYLKPGITGLAQINGRSDISHGQKVEYDIDYVENCSFVLDIKILIRTIRVVFNGEGAY